MFDDNEAVRTLEKVTAYKAYYANTWTEAARPVHRKQLSEILEKKDSFNAIRPLNREALPAFLEQISGRDVDLKIDIGEETIGIILGGHTTSTVRRRRGQREFRFHMMERYIAVNPDSWSIEVAPRLRNFETYGRLEGSLLIVDADRRPDRELLGAHYEEATRVFAHN